MKSLANIMQRPAAFARGVFVRRRHHIVARLRNTNAIFGAFIVLLCAHIVMVEMVHPLHANYNYIRAGNEWYAATDKQIKDHFTREHPSVEIAISSDNLFPGTQLDEARVSFVTLPESMLPKGSIRRGDVAQILGKHVRRNIAQGTILLADDVQLAAPELNAPFRIPEGHRAVSIWVDERTSVEGFATPGKFVDVQFSLPNQGGENVVATVARAAQVLSVAGATQDELVIPSRGSFTMTLLVTEPQARAITLASKFGSPTLALIGDEGGFSAAELSPELLRVRDIWSDSVGPRAEILLCSSKESDESAPWNAPEEELPLKRRASHARVFLSGGPIPGSTLQKL